MTEFFKSLVIAGACRFDRAHRIKEIHAFLFTWFSIICHTVLMPLSHGSEPPTTDMVFAPGSEQIVACSQRGLRVFDAQGLAEVADHPVEQLRDSLPDNLHCLSFSPDGRYLAVGGGNPGDVGSVTIVDWPSTKLVTQFAPHADSVRAIVWLDNQRIASGSFDRSVRLWSVDTSSAATNDDRTQDFLGHSGAVTALGSLATTSNVISAGQDKTIRVWDLENDRVARTLSQHTAPILSLAVRPAVHGELPLVASAASDRTIRLWQPTIGRMVRYARLADTNACKIAWVNEDVIVAGCEDGTVRFIDAERVKVTEIAELKLPAPVYAVLTSADRSAVLVSGHAGQVLSIPYAAALKANQ